MTIPCSANDFNMSTACYIFYCIVDMCLMVHQGISHPYIVQISILQVEIQQGFVVHK